LDPTFPPGTEPVPNALAPAAGYYKAAEAKKFCAADYRSEDKNYFVCTLGKCNKWYYAELLQHKYDPSKWLNRVAHGAIGYRGEWPNPKPGSEAQCRHAHSDSINKKTSKSHKGGPYRFVSKHRPTITNTTNSTSHPPCSSVQIKRKITSSNPKSVLQLQAANPTKKHKKESVTPIKTTKKVSGDAPVLEAVISKMRVVPFERLPKRVNNGPAGE
jgi:hypothetical protein